MRSVSFDRAADFYDATRALPEGLSSKLTQALLTELSTAGTERALEVGAGTGRISRPLAESGIRVCAVDIAPRMLTRFREQQRPGREKSDLVLGDATCLPIASNAFQAILVVNLLHLVSSLELAVEELCRVLGREGILLQGRYSTVGDSPWDACSHKWRELTTKRGFTGRVRPRTADVHNALTRLGGSLRTETVAEDDYRRTPAEYLERLRTRVDSWTWEYPDVLFHDCFAELQRWATQHFGDVSECLVEHLAFEIDVWSFR